MKILIVSDTHGRDRNLELVLEKEKKIDFLIHLGDIEGSEDYIETIAGCTCEMVAGNNDYFSKLPAEKVIEIGNHRMFLTHGHYYNVSVELKTIVEEAAGRDADFAIFGHIHRPVQEQVGAVTVLNPGSLSLPRQANRRPSYMIMNIGEDGSVNCEIQYL